jgi:hypothetical protein
MNTNADADAVKCFFCPFVDGALKRSYYDGSIIFAHLTCVNWIPEIYYDDDRKTKICG